MELFKSHTVLCRKPLLEVLTGRIPSRRPLWLMRQAGRYLPEYRRVRAEAGSFLELCDTPRLACEATMQPLRRFDLDAAIVFADILLVARALGTKLEFRDNEGPVLSPVRSEEDFLRLNSKINLSDVEAVFETISLVKRQLEDHQALIGFCGAPWTVASYMIEGGSAPERLSARKIALQRPVWFGQLVERLIEASVEYLSGQVEAGAEAIQIFDSWAADLPESSFDELVFEPVRRIREGLMKRVGVIPVIGFARGIGAAHLQFAMKSGVNAVSVEPSVPLEWLAKEVCPRISVQGNLDPVAAVVGGEVLKRAVKRITGILPAHSHIFNLGHGIRQETAPENIRELVETVREADGALIG
jgi:uroporphyrinogen decarboxylase